jgi:hypothetical protein
MSQKLIVNAPINSLSLGNISYNILKELYNRKIQVIFFPRQFDLGAYNISPEFKIWLENSINNRFKKYSKDIPTLNIWHLGGSEYKVSDKQYTLSFHETDSPQDAEVNIANQQEHLFFSSNWSVDNFKRAGVDKVSFIPLGFDTDFKVSEKRLVNNDIIHWLIGPYKFEKRKCTQQVLELWIKKYGNNLKHMLTVCVTNPFLRKENNGFDTNDLINSILKGQKFANINILQYLETNAKVNQTLNAADINLSGISAAEGWNLSAFNSIALGKQAIVSNCTAHKDWANDKNSIILEWDGMQPVYDGMHFHPGQPFNQGNYYKFTDEKILESFERAEKVAKNVNTEGLKLQQDFTYKNTVDKILAVINNV